MALSTLSMLDYILGLKLYAICHLNDLKRALFVSVIVVCDTHHYSL